MSGETEVVTSGFKYFTVGFLSNDKGDWGIVLGGGVGYPIEGTISENNTAFLSFMDLIDAISGGESNPCE